MFATAVKLILVPAQIVRRNVAWRTLAFMLAGGVPGVIVGSLFLKHLVTAGSQNLLNAMLGGILVTTAAGRSFYSFRPMKGNRNAQDRSPLLAWLMLPVGAEVGFSSAGAGRAGQCRAAQPYAVVARPGGGHGYRIRLYCVAHRQRRALVFEHRVQHAVTAATDRRRHCRRDYRDDLEHTRAKAAAAFRIVDLADDSRWPVFVQQLSGLGVAA